MMISGSLIKRYKSIGILLIILFSILIIQPVIGQYIQGNTTDIEFSTGSYSDIKGVWLWARPTCTTDKGNEILAEICKQGNSITSIDRLQQDGINSIFLNLDRQVDDNTISPIDDATVYNFIEYAHQKGIKVYANILGITEERYAKFYNNNPEIIGPFTNHRDYAENEAMRVINFNKNHPNAKFDGIIVDLEPHTAKDLPDPDKWYDYLDTLYRIRFKTQGEINLLAACIPFDGEGYEEYIPQMASKEGCNLDSFAIMAYTDSDSKFNTRDIIDDKTKKIRARIVGAGKQYIIGIGAYQDFKCQEDVKDLMNIYRSFPPTGFQGTAIWDYYNFYKCSGIITPYCQHIFNTDFEGYTSGTLPPDFTIKYNGKGNGYQIVTADQSHSGLKSLQFWGRYGYCTNVHYYFNKPESGRIGYEVWVKANPKEEGFVQFVNPDGGDWGWGGVVFDQDGYITAPGGYKKAHTEDKWYKVKAEMDVTTGACWVWLDDELVTNGITPAQDGKANPDAFNGIRGVNFGDCSWYESPSTPIYFDDFVLYVESNRPPSIPVMPSGCSSGNSLTSYTYTTSATDPDSDQIRYIFDWGDETTSETILVNSGLIASESHIWWNAGTYEIKTKAVDSKGAESTWSPLLSVTISDASWSSLGGYINSNPFIIKDDQDRTHIFVKGGDNALWDNADGNWRCLGGIITSDPYAVKDNQGRIHVLVRGSDSSLWDLILDTTANTNQWVGLGGVITSNPTAATFSGNNYLKVVVRGGDNSLWMRVFDTGSLQPISWTPLGGYIASQPRIIYDSQGRTHILVKGGDNALWDNVDGNWRCLGGVITSDPKSLEAYMGDFSTPHKEILTFVRGGDGGLWVNSLNPISNSNQWIGLGGFISPTEQDPEPIIDHRQDVRIYVKGGDGSMWENRYDRYLYTSTCTWHPLGGVITSNPSAVTYVDDNWYLWTDVAVRGSDNALWVRRIPGGCIL